jgi:hypothetical protein
MRAFTKTYAGLERVGWNFAAKVLMREARYFLPVGESLFEFKAARRTLSL